MPFLRFTRDERGYEYTALLHPVRRHGRTDNLLLYCFRTPPYVKVGRPAFDKEAMVRLEQQYPHIRFDWDKILREPPQAISEQEAARRKEQRDARQARRKRKRPADEAVEVSDFRFRPSDEDSGFGVSEEETGTKAPELEIQTSATDEKDQDFENGGDVLTGDAPAEPAAPSGDVPMAAPGSGTKRRRRRRRRGKRREGGPGSSPPAGTPPTGSV